MDWLAGITEILGSAAFGGIIGGALELFKKREAREVLKLQLADKQAERDHRLAEIRAESDASIQLAETEGNIAYDIQDAKTLGQSVAAAAVSTGVLFVDAIRGLMRPVLTLYVLVLVTYIAYEVNRLVGGIEALPADQIFALHRQIIMQILSLAGIVVGWWFACRPPRITA